MPLITTRSAASARGLGFCQQTGPRTSPISGYELWLDSSDASKFTYSSGSVISAWTDKSANGYVFQPVSTSTAPTRTGTQNSKSTVVFDGTDDMLLSTAATSTWKFLHDGTQSTVIIAYKDTRTPVSSTDYVLLDTTQNPFSSITAGYQGYTMEVDQYSVDSYVYSGVIASGQTYPAEVYNFGYFDSANQNTWNVVVDLIDVNNATNNQKIVKYVSQATYPDFANTSGVSNGPFSANSASPASPLTIGKINYSSSTYTYPIKGEIAEIIIYKRKLSVAEKTEMITYLKSKWNI